jgi:iron complex outermembrane recepter protein
MRALASHRAQRFGVHCDRDWGDKKVNGSIKQSRAPVAALTSCILCAGLSLGEASAASNDAGSSTNTDGSDTSPVAATPTSESSTAEPSGLAEIVVTAQKRSQSINSVAMSITAATGDQLTQLGVMDTADLTKIVPGFTFTETGYATPVYSIRGVGFQENSLAASPAVSVYVDEVPLPFPAETLAAGLDLERVEVLKGPQGTLYGENSTGGAINYIAAKPTDHFTAGVDASYGRFNTADVQAFVSGPLADSLQARFSLRAVQSDDWQKSYTSSDTLGAKSQLEARLLLNWLPIEDLKVAVNLSAWQDKSETPAAQVIGIVVQTNLVPIPAGLANYPLSPENDRAADWDRDGGLRRDNRFLQGSVRFDYSLPQRITLTSITSYQHYDRDQPIDADGTSYQDFRVTETGTIKTLFQELRLAGDLFDRGDWIVGGNYQSDDTFDANFLQYADSSSSQALGLPLPDSINRTEQDIRTKAVYGNLDYDVAPALTYQAGVRYTQSDRDFSGCSYDTGSGDGSRVFTALSEALGATPPPLADGSCLTLNSKTYLPGLVTNTLDENNVSWRTGLNWTPAADTLLYGNVSKGYKAGSFPTLSASLSQQFAPVHQESVVAYEIGSKIELLDRSLQLNDAIFYYRYDDKQIRGKLPDPIFGDLEALVNIPQSHIEGAEISAIWQPLRGFTLTPAATFVESRIDGHFSNYTPLGAYQEVSGEAFPYTPKWSANLDANYQWGIVGGYQAFVGANGSHQGKTNAGFGDLPDFDIRAYTLLDLRAGVESPSGDWRVSLYGHNVTDVYYWTSTSHLVDTITRFAGMPATFGVMVNYRFR